MLNGGWVSCSPGVHEKGECGGVLVVRSPGVVAVSLLWCTPPPPPPVWPVYVPR